MEGPEVVRVSRTCVIPYDELQWRFTGSGGPGGQHANTSNTRVEVRFDIAESPSLGPRQRARLLDAFGPSLRVVASDQRSQLRNRELAVERLRSRLHNALRTEKPRIATAVSKSADDRRIERKRHRGEIKRSRKKPELED